jgi:hypothetical protein
MSSNPPASAAPELASETNARSVTTNKRRLAVTNVACMDVWYEVQQERVRAHDKHGDTSMESQPVAALDRLCILVEEIGEVAELFLDARHGPLDNRDHLVSLLRRIVDAAQVAHRLNDQRHDGAAALPTLPGVDVEALRKELIQVSAMAGAWADVCT